MIHSLEAYYDHLEKDTRILDNQFLYKDLDKIKQTLKEIDKQKYCDYEIYFLQFRYKEGLLKPYFSNGNQEFPNLDLFDDNLEYITTRASQIRNHKYRGRYNQILWSSKVKKIENCWEAIDSYIKHLKVTAFLITDSLACRKFSNEFINLSVLSFSVKYKKEKVLDYFISVLGTSKINGFVEYELMDHISELLKKESPNILLVFFDYCNTIIDGGLYSDYTKYYLEFLIKLSHKLKKNANTYREKLAEYYINQVEGKEDFTAQSSYIEALSLYKLTNNKEKAEEVSLLLDESKQYISLKRVPIEIKDKKIERMFKAIDNVIETLITNETGTTVLDYCLQADILLPSSDSLKQNIKPQSLDFITTISFDINSNVSKTSDNFISPYNIYIQNFTVRQLNMIFIKGVENGKVSYDILKEYLEKETWYNNLNLYGNTDDKNSFSYLELILPSLKYFFSQFEEEVKNKEFNSDYILCIDSLTLKFEGLLRSLSRMIGAQAIEPKLNYVEEKINFEALLSNPKMTDIIPAKDIAFFRYLFTKDGFDIRNNIAHCFYKPKHYGPSIMFLLITAIIRLGNYTIKNPTSN
jgi:hypothetical protein